MELFIRKTSSSGFLKEVCFSNLLKEKRRAKQPVNMPRQLFDIREDEQLSNEIRKYPCLFGKMNSFPMRLESILVFLINQMPDTRRRI